ncbi:GbsR/MarR family transcriptional regulator [Planctobacterium marinum]|uniref:GbsR/MarR family transcriptional regulator n=1 Tax=Planctobacterium marinum TaxID=1631968 RepID=UPI001E2C5BFC|nr:GbsR/MarR family transcriptional regulator [Planctobacterium marinum]MCC2607958.1 GbsR/MarR family transcriptional regulator [Planctobacterium marinum]
MNMTPIVESFVLHFGEMGSRWGFNRTVGQMYALLVVSKDPLTANQLAEELNISRGNVSMGIKELQSWQLICTKHIPGDRKEYYLALGSIWDMAMKVFEERRKREVDPTLSMLRGALLQKSGNDKDAYAQEKLHEIHDLLETVTTWSHELQSMNPDKLNTLMKLGSGVGKVLDFKEKVLKKSS